jgi:hypothetical protein
MFRRLALSATLGGLLLTVMSCAEEPQKKEGEPAPAAKAAPAEPEAAGPVYELTKDQITSHPDWTSMNIAFKGAKLGDKGSAIDKALGKGEKTEPIGPQYRTIYGKSSFAIYTFQNTGELQKIEIYGKIADQIADAKLRQLLSSGDLEFMRKTLGKEEMSEQNFNTTGMEYIYDAKGFRFVTYNLGGQKVNSLLFSKVKKETPKEPAK